MELTRRDFRYPIKNSYIFFDAGILFEPEHSTGDALGDGWSLRHREDLHLQLPHRVIVNGEVHQQHRQLLCEDKCELYTRYAF